MNLEIRFWPIAIGCMFVSLMIHELGHALAFRRYGMDSSIFLYSFGGLAVPDGRLSVRSQRIIVSLAGPAANFLLFGIAWGTNYVQPWALTNDYTWATYNLLYFINIFLALINLLPVYPLDGGQVSKKSGSKYRPGIERYLLAANVADRGDCLFSYSFACHFNAIPVGWTVDWLRPGLFAAILFAISP
jgi:Zn-dependent protease